MSALTISEASILRYASAETLDVSKVFLVPLLNSILVEFFFKEFLDWLAATLKILPDKDGRKGIDALVGKSKRVDYPGDYQKGELPLAFEELRDILLKNKARLGANLSDSELVDQIKARYEESLGRVLPVKERLARTDVLIDQVVYGLYGLTAEEIRVVEGKV